MDLGKMLSLFQYVPGMAAVYIPLEVSHIILAGNLLLMTTQEADVLCWPLGGKMLPLVKFMQETSGSMCKCMKSTRGCDAVYAYLMLLAIGRVLDQKMQIVGNDVI